jgi:hypothetical protein
MTSRQRVAALPIGGSGLSSVRVEFIDSSILCNLLDIPGKNESHTTVLEEFRARALRGTTFVIPVAAVIETGNHIEQVNEGGHRRRCGWRTGSAVKVERRSLAR